MATATSTTRPAAPPYDVHVRQLRDGDCVTVERVFAQLSVTSAYLRFGTGTARLTPRALRSLARVEAGVQAVFVAEAGGRPVGLGRWVRDPQVDRPDAAELALEVADAWQGRGVGRRLVEVVALDAARSGIRSLHAHVDPANGWVTSWLRRLGATNPGAIGEPFVLSVADLTHGRVSGSCGCMTRCSSASSAPSG